MRPNVILALLLASAPLAAQTPGYQPSNELPQRAQLLALYIGASDCAPCRSPELKQAIARMKPLAQQQALAAGMDFEAIGVALDWDIQQGLDMLGPLTEYDEVAVGSNWANLAAVRFIWSDTTAVPGLPQVVLVRRTLSPGQTRIGVGQETIMARFVGADVIERWVERGAPVTGLQ